MCPANIHILARMLKAALSEVNIDSRNKCDGQKIWKNVQSVRFSMGDTYIAESLHLFRHAQPGRARAIK